MGSKTIIQLQDLTVEYPGGVLALGDINLEIFEKDFIGLIGPNGAGKSTLLNVILGLVKPTKGTVKLFDAPICPKNLQRVGYVPQIARTQDANFPSTVFETILLGRIPQRGLFRRLGKQDHQKTEDVLRMLDIYDLRKRKIGNLSGGQSQRVFVAKALVSDPKVLILDEPTSGVDVPSKKEFYRMLEDLNQGRGITIILSSHDIGIVTKLANRVICINRSLFFCGGLSEFKSSSALSKAYEYPVELVQHDSHA